MMTPEERQQARKIAQEYAKYPGSTAMDAADCSLDEAIGGYEEMRHLW
jgi:hypothetical protein